VVGRRLVVVIESFDNFHQQAIQKLPGQKNRAAFFYEVFQQTLSSLTQGLTVRLNSLRDLPKVEELKKPE
jgi:hypothetical protein